MVHHFIKPHKSPSISIHRGAKEITIIYRGKPTILKFWRIGPNRGEHFGYKSTCGYFSMKIAQIWHYSICVAWMYTILHTRTFLCTKNITNCNDTHFCLTQIQLSKVILCLVHTILGNMNNRILTKLKFIVCQLPTQSESYDQRK